MSKNFSSDKPVENSEEDRFQRYGFSKRIADTIKQRDADEGIVIGIYGAWGEGKTSVLNFIQNELNQDDTILQVSLNPWRYNDEETLIKNFLKKIAEVLGKELDSKKEKFGSFIERYGSFGSIIGKDLTDVGKTLSNVDLEELKNRIDEFLKEGKSKLVIFVDDIDRLDKQEIYSLFRLVKLTADFTNTTYILSFDEQMVASAIGDRFGAGNEKSGQNFLEKIIQVPLQIPQAQIAALKKYCFELVDKAINESELELNKEEVQRFVSAFSHNVLLRLSTPRMAVRYGNSLSFAIPLLKGEVNHVDLMLMEAIKIFYPKHYEFIKNNSNYFTSSYSSHSYGGQDVKGKKDELSEHLDNLGSDLSKAEKGAILNLLKSLFPRLNEAFHNTFQHEGHKEWLKEKRVVSTSYFNRYFSYAVIDGELSDVAFDEFINSVENAELVDTAKKIKEIIEQSSVDTFLFKIRTYEEDLSWKSTMNLSLSISLMGDLFPKSKSFFAFGMNGAQTQAAIFIYNLLKKYKNEEEVFELSKILMGKDIPYDFAYALNNWMRSGKTPEEKLFTNEQYIELAKILRTRLLEECGEKSIFEVFPDNLSYIFSTWFEESPKELESYLKGFIDKDAEQLKQLLVAMTPTVTSTNHPEPYKSNFTKEDYEYLTNILDKDYLHKIISVHYSEEVEKEKVQFFDFENNQTDLNILRQFEHWYSKDDGIQEAEIVE
ncbi:KAP family P-loop NTPase fold protein [Maribacter thermophilus]|uniref:KAP family P-loop NTPase fold protein n=1 Tax=Maribacter thermophilus TaxID=1197874 RepID=UPI0006414F73|nr:KAP family NTPase [Maribacter thermophilus]